MPNYAQAPTLINNKSVGKGNFIQIDSDVFSNVVKALGRKYKAALLFMWLAGQKNGFKIPLKTVCDALGFTKSGYYDARKDLVDAGILTVTEEIIKINYDVIAGKLPKSSKGTDFPDTTALSESSKGTDFPDTSTKNRVLKIRTPENPDTKIVSGKPGQSSLKGTENPDTIFAHCPENPDTSMGDKKIVSGKPGHNLSGKPGQPCPENPEYNIENIEKTYKGISSVEEFLKTDFVHKDDPMQKATGEELLGACDGNPERLLQVFECYPETQKCKEYFAGVDWTAYEF